jgi:TonB family protein
LQYIVAIVSMMRCVVCPLRGVSFLGYHFRIKAALLLAVCFSLPLSGLPQQSADPAAGVKANRALQAQVPAPAANGINPSDAHVLPPTVIFAPPSKYTFKARLKGLEGVTKVALVIDAQGMPQDVHLAESLAGSVSPNLQSTAAGLDENALKVVKKYRFKPGTLQGKAVAVNAVVEVNFLIAGSH